MSTDRDDKKKPDVVWGDLSFRGIRNELAHGSVIPIWTKKGIALVKRDDAQTFLGQCGLDQKNYNSVIDASTITTLAAIGSTLTAETHLGVDALLRSVESDDKPSTAVEPGEPPAAAAFCIGLFMRGPKGEALIGCLSERFDRDCRRYGIPHARRMYWAQTLRSLWPLLRRAAIRVIKCGIVAEVWRRLSGHG